MGSKRAVLYFFKLKVLFTDGNGNQGVFVCAKMALARLPFICFAAGFATALFIVQFINKTTKWPRAISFWIGSWIIYISTHGIYYWYINGYEAPPGFSYMVPFSTIFFAITLSGILDISTNRTIAFFPTINPMWRKVSIAMNAIIFIIRMVRSVILFIDNNGTVLIPVVSIMHFVTLFIVLIVRIVLDCIAYKKMWDMRIKQNDSPAALEAFKKIMRSLFFEICTTIVAIAISFLEAISYKGDSPAYMGVYDIFYYFLS